MPGTIIRLCSVVQSGCSHWQHRWKQVQTSFVKWSGSQDREQHNKLRTTVSLLLCVCWLSLQWHAVQCKFIQQISIYSSRKLGGKTATTSQLHALATQIPVCFNCVQFTSHRVPWVVSENLQDQFHYHTNTSGRNAYQYTAQSAPTSTTVSTWQMYAMPVNIIEIVN